MLDWWYNFLPSIIQSQWIGVRKIENVETVYGIYKVKSNFLNPEFLDAYLPSQPNLLCALILLLLFSAVIFLVFCAFCLAERIGAFRKHKNFSSYFSAFSSKSSSKRKIFNENRPSHSFTTSYLLLILVWSILFVTSIIFMACLMDLGQKSNGDGSIEQVEAESHLSSHYGRSKLTEFEDHQTEIPNVEEKLLNKFNDIRELGYEFKPMERDATNFAKYFLLFVILGLYGISLLVSVTAMIIGVRTRHSIERHSSNYDYTFDFDRATGLMNRAGKALFILSVLLFAISPFVNVLGAILLIHSHASTAICPFDQTVTQNANIEEYINANYGEFEAISLVDFLGDLSHDRVEINRLNCEQYVRPMQGTWACLLVLSWLSLVFVGMQIRLSRFFTQNSDDNWSSLMAENSVAMAAGWPNYSTEAETYAAAVDAYSKYSFGTFVYQKY